MQRSPLKKGTEINSKNKIVIDSVIGEGGNGIVYNAHFFDSLNNSKQIRLKECYPNCDGIIRKGQKLEWPNSQLKEGALAWFKHSYNIADQIKREVTLDPSSVYTLDLFELNGTMYMAVIPDPGITYDKDNSIDVVEAIKTVLALTNVVSAYHRLGYLHLDIKPSNFMAFDDSTGIGKNIVLFDVDSVTSIEDIRNGSVNLVSYSIDWAAPEQQQQNLDQLCPATDLFSIGAVLFSRIMGRLPCYEDEYDKREWEFDERLQGKNINPAVLRILNEVFYKTLSADVKLRFYSADELAEKLEEVLDLLINGIPFVISNLAPLSCKCLGREREKEQIHDSIKQSGKVFLRGIGGIGKSTLVRAYADEYCSDYDAMVLLSYDPSVSIIDLLDSVPMGNVSKEDDKYYILRTVCDERTLIIIDNLDVGTDEENLDLLFSLNCHIFITTRTDFRDAYENIPNIEVSGLNRDALRELYETESATKVNNEEIAMLEPMFLWGEECTLFWFMFARLVRAGGYSVEEILHKFSDDFAFGNSEKVLLSKDGKHNKITIADALDELFRLANLTDRQMEVLHNIYFLQTLGISKKIMREVAQDNEVIVIKEYIDALNELIELGYVQELGDAGYYLGVSDVLGETIVHNTQPELRNAIFVNALINANFFISWEDDSDCLRGEVRKEKVRYYYGCLAKIFIRADMSLDTNTAYVVDALFHLVGREVYLAEILQGKLADYFIEFMLNVANDLNRSPKMRMEAYTVLCELYEREPLIWSNERVTKEKEDDVRPSQDCFMRSVELAMEIGCSKVDMDILCAPILKQCMKETLRLMSVETLDTLMKLMPPVNRRKEQWDIFKIIVYRNLPYQKLFLKREDERADLVSDSDREEIYYRAIGKILCSGVIRDPYPYILDKEHFNLLRKFLVHCENKFEKNSDVNFNDFVDNPMYAYPSTLYTYEFEGLLNTVTQETWEDFSIDLEEKYSRQKQFAQNGNLFELCEKISAEENLYDMSSIIASCCNVLSSMTKDDLDVQKDQLLVLIKHLSYVDQEMQIPHIDADGFYDIYNTLSPIDKGCVYSVMTIAYVAIGDFSSAYSSFKNYLSVVNYFTITEEDKRLSKIGIMIPYLEKIISSIYKWGYLCFAILLFMDYIEMVESIPIFGKLLSKEKLYELYKCAVEWVEGEEINLREKLSYGEMEVVSEIEGTDFSSLDEIIQFLKEVKDKYLHKMANILPKKFND